VAAAAGLSGGPVALRWDAGALRLPEGHVFQGVLMPRALRGLADGGLVRRILLRETDPVLEVLQRGLLRRLGLEPVAHLPADAVLLGPGAPVEATEGLPFVRRGGQGSLGVPLPMRPDLAGLRLAFQQIGVL
jgi:hypothetical protein